MDKEKIKFVVMWVITFFVIITSLQMCSIKNNQRDSESRLNSTLDSLSVQLKESQLRNEKEHEKLIYELDKISLKMNIKTQSDLIDKKNQEIRILKKNNQPK